MCFFLSVLAKKNKGKGTHMHNLSYDSLGYLNVYSTLHFYTFNKAIYVTHMYVWVMISSVCVILCHIVSLILYIKMHDLSL